MLGKHTNLKILTVLFTAAIGSQSLALSSDDLPGKALFVEKKCNRCHTVESQQIETTKGDDDAPDMSNAGAMVPSAEWAKKFILREERKDGKKHKRPYKGSEKDLDLIVAWLMTLKSS